MKSLVIDKIVDQRYSQILHEATKKGNLNLVKGAL